ncbi:bidirectional sugar transporter SWEET10-like [Tripterygium wilfordii]|nr:bidirectional sugar transporter SWEET10-like [Tripterygium wilfordii]
MAFHITRAFAFGILGNLISFLVSLAPLATFYKIYKRKSSEGFQSIPYVISLFSAMLWLFYAIFKKDATLLITINIFTFFMQTGYIIVYFVYASKKDRILTAKLVLLFDVFGFGVICLLALFLTKGEKRIAVLGWICMVFALCVFVAPLGIMKKVIQTKSVEFMPFSLSFFLTLSGVMWFFYGFLTKDLFVAVPNILGFLFGMAQMSLYGMYRNYKKKLPTAAEVEPKLQELSEQIVDVVKLSAMVCSHDLIITPAMINFNMGTEKAEDDKDVIKEETKV